MHTAQSGARREPESVPRGEGARRAAKHTQSREEWWRGAGGQPNTLRAGRSGGGGREGSQSTLRAGRSGGGSRRAAKHALRAREDVVEGAGGQPSTLRAGRSGGGGQEGSQTHSEQGGV